jgi:D-alanyl-D-alanine dipeptidase
MIRMGRIALRAFLLLSAVSFAPLLPFRFTPALFALPQQNFSPAPKPPDIPAEWKVLIGDYGKDPNPNHFVVLERDGELFATGVGGKTFKLARTAPGTYTPSNGQTAMLALHLDAKGKAVLQVGSDSIDRQDDVAATDRTFRIYPLIPVEELRIAALKDSPPVEARPLRQPELVELALLDPAIHLDIRYASSNNFLGTPIYSQARAFLQRPAAEAILRVARKLKSFGYGLLIHDAYRPWYVTKIFWEATPPEAKIFVARPSQGSRHNRGCAADLTLYDLTTGKPVEMPGTYDEMSPRSFPSYPGGTSLERWHRELLRSAMESDGFKVYDAEWWHFDYKDWKEYPILNVPFEKLGVEQGSTLTH